MLKYLQQIADISLTLQPQSKRNSFSLWGDETFWQTCPLVSRVGITEQTQHRADVTFGKADQD